MRKTSIQAIFLFLLLLLFIGGCSNTRLVSSWSEPSYESSLNKVLVLGLSKNSSIKRVYESTMAQAFRESGVEAEEAGDMLPKGTEQNRDEIKAALTNKGYDAILVTRTVSKKEETYFVANRPYRVPHPYYNGFYDYYGRVYPTVYSPGYLATDTIVSLETNIYELKDGKLIWAVVSESINVNDINKEVGVLSELFIKRLKKDGLVKS